MNQENLNKLINEVLAIETDEAKAAGALGFMARALVQATMPHKKQEQNEFIRRNGDFKLTMLAPSDTGLPYGSIPRLLMAWISTEAVRTKQKELILGRSLSEFMAQLDLVPTGGRWGTITRLRDQMARLFSCSISCTYTNGSHWAIQNVNPINRANLWWDPKQPNQMTLIESSVTLGDAFSDEIIANPIPIDLRALKALKRSPLALDIYCWITYRVSYLKKPITIPWAVLQNQFGSNYANNPHGLRNFKQQFLKELHKVYCIYGSLDVSHETGGLILRPSPPHIPLILSNK